jgi:hypothetical protein
MCKNAKRLDFSIPLPLEQIENCDWQQRNHLQGLRTLLAQIATHDPDEEVRLYAQALLQQLP